MADLIAVQAVLAKVDRELERPYVCKCAVNAFEPKGPCDACNYKDTLAEVKKRGTAVLAITDPLAFDHEATEFLQVVQLWVPWLK
jgi:hypothetical protein